MVYAWMLAIALLAPQVPVDRPDSEITASGCLMVSPRGDYTIVSRETQANGRQETRTWKLDTVGTTDPRLMTRLMQRVEVKGRLVPDEMSPVGTSGTVGAATPADRGFRLRPRVVKMLSSSCAETEK